MGRPQDPVFVIVGPTASGKSALSIRLAQELDGEIVNADSMQIYRGMDIGTAKVPPAERIVRHFGIDIVDPGDPYSVALYQGYARHAFEEIWAADRRPILSGGTGFYVRAAIDDYQFVAGDQKDNPVRAYYQAVASQQGAERVWKLLEEVDPESAHLIPPKDLKRVIRAFEMRHEGTSYAERRKGLKDIKQRYPAVFVGIDVERETLRKRIDRRVDAMREQGLEDEVRELLGQGFRDALTSAQAIGYKEIVQAIEGDVTLDEAFERIKTATRRYAKRQRTWFRGDKRIEWIDGSDGSITHMTQRALDAIRKAR